MAGVLSLVRELQGLPRPAVVFAHNDRLAADVIDACRDGGLRVPEGVAVLGVRNGLVGLRAD